MKKSRPQFGVMLIFALGVIRAHAGTISCVAIPAAQSDANCGISTDHGYTSAVDGGNTSGTDRIINGITLYALTGNGQNSSTADNCTLNALSGTLTDSAVTSKRIQADGTMRDALSDMVVNNGGGDNSQQEIVLDPESLEAGSTYDLRVYVNSSSGQNRQVNLAFFGDGQNAAETGFFNEDDARTSAGGFKDANQVYYINFRYTWDGDSTPGITITQKSGGAPFCLYALTNELVSEGGAAGEGTAAAGAAGGGAEAAAGGAAGGGAGPEGEGLSSGLVDQESDEVGVQSDDFYNSESLNSHGRWIKLSKWGTCWQPTDVSEGWCPYTNGNWKDCDDCGWTFDSDEPWAWACYHYGRWCKVRTGCGWAWVPGKVWASSWVSWRQGRDSSCIGWAPLPPEAGCDFGVGISSWIDETCNIGPECYTFVNIRDFGSDSYSGCGCIYERSRNTTIIIDTFNCTNISYGRTGTYCGGPDYNWCNTEIRRRGGRECGKIYVNRYDNPGKLGGKFARREGNQLGLVSPRIKGERNPQHMPKTAENVGANKIDHGWGGVNKKQEAALKQHIAQETKGKNPKNSPATLPSNVAQKLGKQHGVGGAGQTGQAGAGNLHPGGKGKGKAQGAGLQGGATGQGQAQGGFNQHPGGKGRRKGQGQAGGANAAAGGAGQGAGFNQHPGKGNRGRGQAGAAGRGAGANALQGGNQQAGGFQGGRHPGQSLKKQKGLQGGAGPAGGGAGMAGGGGQAGQGGGQHPGKHKGKGAQGAQTGAGGGQAGANIQGGGTQGGQAGGQGAGGGKGRHKGKQTQGQVQGGTQGGQGGMTQGTAGQAGQGGQGAGGGGGGKGRHKQQQTRGLQGGQATQGGGTGGTGGQGQGSRGRHKQQQTLQGAQATQGGGTGGTGGQGQGGKGHRKQQQPTQQFQQTQGQGVGGGGRQRQQQQLQQRQPSQQQGGGGGKGKRAKPTPTPH